MSFQALGLVAPLFEAVRAAGYTEPTPIQAAAIPPALAGRDVLGCAQTGTGKTAAFSLPVLQQVDKIATKTPAVRCLILTPTRELAAQIGESLETYGRGLDLWHTVIFGGVNEKPQIRELEKGVDILVATPGRLLDLLGRKFVDLSRIEMFVLDEADRMLDMGFINDIRKIVDALPKKRQTLFFSATMPPAIRTLADSMLVDPVSVAVDPVSSTADKIEQRLYFTNKADKRQLLVDVLGKSGGGRTLVFSRTKHGADRVVRHLTKAGITAASIHGNKSQGARLRALDGFRKGTIPLLVATDIAARGIDVEGVTHVINFDLPNIPETYVHRIGRTARAGASGTAISFCEPEEYAYVDAIERLIGQHLVRVDDHDFPPSVAPPRVSDLDGGGPRSETRPERNKKRPASRRSRSGRRRKGAVNAAQQAS